jgi:hypothetical protein
MPKWSFRRIVFFGAMGSLAGVAAMQIAPVTVSQQRLFSTVSPLRTVGQYDPVTSGRLLIATACDVASNIEPSLPDVRISCLDNYGAAGVGTMRISSPSAEQTLHAYTQLTATLRQMSYLTYFDTQAKAPPISDRASIWRTAPASGAALGVAVGFVAPLPLRRRRVPRAERGPVKYRFAPIFG